MKISVLAVLEVPDAIGEYHNDVITDAVVRALAETFHDDCVTTEVGFCTIERGISAAAEDASGPAS